MRMVGMGCAVGTHLVQVPCGAAGRGSGQTAQPPVTGPPVQLGRFYSHMTCQHPAPVPCHAQVVLLLDADFLPARALSELIHEPLMYEQLRRVTGYRQVRGGRRCGAVEQ